MLTPYDDWDPTYCFPYGGRGECPHPADAALRQRMREQNVGNCVPPGGGVCRHPHDLEYGEIIHRASGGRYSFYDEEPALWTIGNTGLAREAIERRDRRRERAVVVKIMWQDLVTDAHARERFNTELEYLLWANRTQDSVAVRMMCEDEEEARRYVRAPLPFLVLEPLGFPYERVSVSLRREGYVILTDIFEVIAQLADFLDRLHADGRTYDEIKPGHMFWDRVGKRLKVIDFDRCPRWSEGRQAGPGEVASDISRSRGLALMMLTNTHTRPEGFLDASEADDSWRDRWNDTPVAERVRQFVEGAGEERCESAAQLRDTARRLLQELRSGYEQDWLDLDNAAQIFSRAPTEGEKQYGEDSIKWSAESPCRLEWERIRLSVRKARQG